MNNKFLVFNELTHSFKKCTEKVEKIREHKSKSLSPVKFKANIAINITFPESFTIFLIYIHFYRLQHY